jgi:nitric oxide reductase subunit B
MEYGSIFGHGAYLGPDYTDDYLHRAALSVERQYGGAASDTARQRTIDDFQANRYDPDTNTIVYSAAQARAFGQLRGHYAGYFGDPTTQFGLRPDAITSQAKIHQLTAFFSWSAWAAAARRPGHDYSYTNNWPSEKLVENQPTANVILWSVVSLIALLGGIGLLFGAFGRWNGLLLAPSPPALALLGSMLAAIVLAALRMSRAFAAMPSGFPEIPIR